MEHWKRCGVVLNKYADHREEILPPCLRARSSKSGRNVIRPSTLQVLSMLLKLETSETNLRIQDKISTNANNAVIMFVVKSLRITQRHELRVNSPVA